jgi:NodT family efflux transporter outer membrane factor (OMF) lipoprotein
MAVSLPSVRKPAAAALAAAVASLLLSACAAIPHLGTPPTPKAPEAYATAQSFAGAPGEWPSEAWWTSFKDPQLDALMEEAVADSPTMAQAQARLRDAVARSDADRSALFPTVTANASSNRQKLSYNGVIPGDAVPHGWNDLGQATLDVSWELDFWGKNRSAFRAAVSDAWAADADAAGARLVLTASLADTYVRLAYLMDLHDVAATTLRNRQDAARLVQQRVAQGLDTQLPVEEAAARVSLAQASLADVDERVALTRNSLAALLGKGPDRGLTIARPTLSARLSPGLPATLGADLLGHKPEVVAARWRVEAAAKRIGVARAAFYPDVNIVGFLGFQSLGLGNLTAAGSGIGSIGPAIHLPIFEGGKLRANYRGARAEYDLAVATYDEALTQVLHETADAARSLDALTDRRIALDEALARSEKAYRLARARYEGGLSDYQTVLTAEDLMLQAQVDHTAIHMRAYALDVALVKALGGGFDSHPTFEAQVTP